MFAKIPFKINKFLANMGRARARASQIYCVIRPERNAVERECNVARSDSGVSQFFPYARQSGTGKAFIGKGGVQETIIAGIISVLISGLLLRLRGLSVLLVAVLIALIVGRYCVKKFGGLTGDNLGLINELGEIVALVGVTIII